MARFTLQLLRPWHRASMGPRPLGRGWITARPTSSRYVSSFNGAATARSRMEARVCRTCWKLCEASMGPRPLGRGWAAVFSAHVRHLDASMGPRPLGRGWHRLAGSPLPWGGASMGPRPLGRGWNLEVVTWVVDAAGFNGAATARSRMASRGGGRPTPAPWLQWGRDR